MADLFKWDEQELGLNTPDMDHEHQVLIDKMNAMIDAHNKGTDFPAVLVLINELADFTVQHFHDEEEYMASIDFPGLESHKGIHKMLLSQFQDHVEQAKEAQSVSDSFIEFLKFWLTSHIRFIDGKYAVHTGSKSKAA